MKPNKIRIVLNNCYLVLNKHLRIKDRNGEVMGGFHHVFVLAKSKDGKKVKVKTITSLENVDKEGKRTFRKRSLDAVRNGEIIVIPTRLLNNDRLSGINQRSIWVDKKYLQSPKIKFKYPKLFNEVIKK